MRQTLPNCPSPICSIISNCSMPLEHPEVSPLIEEKKILKVVKSNKNNCQAVSYL
jgi:hypothetical protein